MKPLAGFLQLLMQVNFFEKGFFYSPFWVRARFPNRSIKSALQKAEPHRPDGALAFEMRIGGVMTFTGEDQQQFRKLP